MELSAPINTNLLAPAKLMTWLTYKDTYSEDCSAVHQVSLDFFELPPWGIIDVLWCSCEGRVGIVLTSGTVLCCSSVLSSFPADGYPMKQGRVGVDRLGSA